MDFVDAVRARPRMYVGGTDAFGLHHLLWEVVANSVDQFLAGHAKRVDVRVFASGAIEVSDDGSGIATHVTDDGRAFLERVLTSMHLTPTADGHAPHLHVGLHGIGLAAVCALCESVVITVKGSEGRFEQSFARGRATSTLRRFGDPSASGTTVRLLPDLQIFEHRRWDLARIDRRLREFAALQPGLETSLQVERQRYGPCDLRELLSGTYSVLPEPFLLVGNEGRMSARIALDWNRWDEPPAIQQFANLIATRDGDHFKGLQRGLARAFAELGSNHGREWVRPWDVLSRGMSAVVSVMLIDPEYGSPTRDRLVHPRVGKLVERTVAKELPPLMNRIPDFRDELLTRLR